MNSIRGTERVLVAKDPDKFLGMETPPVPVIELPGEMRRLKNLEGKSGSLLRGMRCSQTSGHWFSISIPDTVLLRQIMFTAILFLSVSTIKIFWNDLISSDFSSVVGNCSSLLCFLKCYFFPAINISPLFVLCFHHPHLFIFCCFSFCFIHFCFVKTFCPNSSFFTSFRYFLHLFRRFLKAP